MVNSHNGSTPFAEIANWKSDAKLEKSSRYFYETEEVERLRGGERSYVIGRKGTGKTAIAHHITGMSQHNAFSMRLSLKNFPWKILYPLKDNTFPRPNEYITLWKYVIYVSIIKLMTDNEAIDLAFRNEVNAVLPNNIGSALATTIKQVTGGNFSISGIFKAVGLSAGATAQHVENPLAWIEKVEILEAAIARAIDISNYYLVFDDLDEDYKYQSIFEANRDYIEVITGLFKAVQNIRSIFDKVNIFPIVFLRDDIFDLIQDNDKTKLLDLAVNLSWTDQTIKPLLAFRIERAKNKHYNHYNFRAAWNSVFSGQIGVGTDGRKLTRAFSHLFESSGIPDAEGI